MTSSSSTGVLARVPELIRGAPREQGGTLWRLVAGARQLDAHVLRLGPGAEVASHVEPDLDVLLYVTEGDGWLVADGTRRELTPGTVVWIARGTPRGIGADPTGLTYLTVHRRRPGRAARPAATRGPCAGCGRPPRDPGARFCCDCGTRLG
ncbi:cupin domain-containing protein [Streptomyces sp. NPDC127068]|uniref:cupin domain-containing protein n=1 Tax=Streptomyces sp. NPDC127068 TaxID=3347127 RepID=UPI003645F9DD